MPQISCSGRYDIWQYFKHDILCRMQLFHCDFVLHINSCRFCNHSIWWWRYFVRWLSGKAAEPAMQRDIPTVSDDNWHCSGVNADTACSLWERAICWHQCWLCSEEQVKNRLLLVIFCYCYLFSGTVTVSVICYAIRHTLLQEFSNRDVAGFVPSYVTDVHWPWQVAQPARQLDLLLAMVHRCYAATIITVGQKYVSVWAANGGGSFAIILLAMFTSVLGDLPEEKSIRFKWIRCRNDLIQFSLVQPTCSAW